MSTPLVSRSADLRRLLADGYEVSVRENHLVVEHVPYLDVDGNVGFGVIVSELVVAGDTTARPDPHTVYFTGIPHNAKGVQLDAIIAGVGQQPAVAGFEPQSYLSTKPASGHYDDYHQKIAQYVGVIGGPARRIDPTVSARTYRPVPAIEEVSPHVYLDSASARAGVSDLSDRLARAGDIAIIGVGGTGSYILDLTAKTPVPAIHLWDPDEFLTHNAFRAPGAATITELNARMSKVDYFAQKYSAIHRGVVPHAAAIDASNIESLQGMGFVFIAIDTGRDKEFIATWLMQRGIPFIDVGMGVYRRNDALRGIVRATLVTPDYQDHVERRISFADEREDEYDRNIQIADLNALNATLAVIRWKRLHGFYASDVHDHQTTYTTASNQLTSSEIRE